MQFFEEFSQIIFWKEKNPPWVEVSTFKKRENWTPIFGFGDRRATIAPSSYIICHCEQCSLDKVGQRGGAIQDDIPSLRTKWSNPEWMFVILTQSETKGKNPEDIRLLFLPGSFPRSSRFRMTKIFSTFHLLLLSSLYPIFLANTAPQIRKSSLSDFNTFAIASKVDPVVVTSSTNKTNDHFGKRSKCWATKAFFRFLALWSLESLSWDKV